jgi:hypothetical protein
MRVFVTGRCVVALSALICTACQQGVNRYEAHRLGCVGPAAHAETSGTQLAGYQFAGDANDMNSNSASAGCYVPNRMSMHELFAH